MHFNILFRRLLPSHCAFTSYQDITKTPSPPTALSAKTVAIMAHNKGLELGADMVLLQWGRPGWGGLAGGSRVGVVVRAGGWGAAVCAENNTLGLLELLPLKVSNGVTDCRTHRAVTSSPGSIENL